MELTGKFIRASELPDDFSVVIQYTNSGIPWLIRIFIYLLTPNSINKNKNLFESNEF